jgi:predicted CoA-substrate-specific enzyme activase
MVHCLQIDSSPRGSSQNTKRFLGIDVGAETIKLVELVHDAGGLRWSRRRLAEHDKKPTERLRALLQEWDWASVASAAVSGRLGKLVRLPQVPTPQAQARACRYLAGDQPATVVSIGSHGFSVLELRAGGVEVFRENSRCSQGTGNFLRQLVERFSLTIEEASAIAAATDGAAPLSGRCPVILKSDMTHLANKGEDRARILAGLFDAVAENVLVLLKPDISPPRLVLVGGVSRAPRIQRAIGAFATAHAMTLLALPEEAGLYFEALGCALIAAERGAAEPVPALESLIALPPETQLERVPPLAASLNQVHRLTRRPPAPVEEPSHGPLILGFDIGSTGSKAVAIDAATCDLRWEDYRDTLGNPVAAAQALLERFQHSRAGEAPVLAVGVTGSGREIVGSLLANCYGKEAVCVLNEIAAHAAGAVHYDPRVDTIFEIGGQDAKYSRLADGRVVDCAMNEACSAGTGSFIAEQGRKFAGIRDVVQLGQEALAACEGVSLGQHCSVFMAEIIDNAVAAGVDQRTIIAGLYDSIVQNYLHRVKGNRTVGKVIFCQGMPFSSDALAAAVARQTGSDVIIPPSPGTVGALGIALLAQRELPLAGLRALDLPRFLTARVGAKDTFACKATTGCGAPGNRCRIERLQTVVADRRQVFTWGGGCALHDRGTRRKKLPDLALDPFREREELIQRLISGLSSRRAGETAAHRHTVALSDEFMLKGLFPFFATFLHELGLTLRFVGGCDQAALKRGIQDCHVPFCAPMQQFHGLVSRMAETGAEQVFLPMIRSLPRVDGEPHAGTCPIAQASPDLLRWDLKETATTRVLSPVIDVGAGNLESAAFLAGCAQLAAQAGCPGEDWKRAHRRAAAAQAQFEHACDDIGRRALDFCQAHGIAPVVVLGRPYTIYNTVLNSNVPALLREQGAIGIPLDCYPVDDAVPTFKDMYWSHGQRILRAAHQIRRARGVYSLYCSNYSCGPDSFNLHFFAYIMEGKPFAVIETDGHSGDAGTKTRIEAFLHCVGMDLPAATAGTSLRDFHQVERQPASLPEILRQSETLLIPWIGPSSQAVAAALQGLGLPAESLPMPDAESLRRGRRHTSGKECLPMCLTLGNLLQRLERERTTDRRFALLMTTTNGPCREGCYNLLNQITLERLGWADRVRIWSPADTGYFDDLPGGLSALIFTAMMASDLLQGALHDVRPVEIRPGAARQIYDRNFARLLREIQSIVTGDLSLPAALWQVATGRLFGLRRLLADAAGEFALVRTARALPTVLVVGEVYVRGDAFANNFIVDQLEARGLRARLAPLNEWLEYSDLAARSNDPGFHLGARVGSAVQQRIQNLIYTAVAPLLGWPERPLVRHSLEAAGCYLRTDLEGEAVLTIGGPVDDWRRGRIDAVVSVGPLECMPNKIAEAQLFHAAEKEGLLSLTLSLNGDPADAGALDNFAFAVHARFAGGRSRPGAVRPTVNHGSNGLPLAPPMAARP